MPSAVVQKWWLASDAHKKSLTVLWKGLLFPSSWLCFICLLIQLLKESGDTVRAPGQLLYKRTGLMKPSQSSSPLSSQDINDGTRNSIHFSFISSHKLFVLWKADFLLISTKIQLNACDKNKMYLFGTVSSSLLQNFIIIYPVYTTTTVLFMWHWIK